MQIVCSFMFLIADSLLIMSFVRFFYGFSFGFTVALTTSMYA
jgi:hypothetical protein